MRKSKPQTASDCISESDDPRLPPYSRLQDPKYLTFCWRWKHRKVEMASVEWALWKKSQRRDQSPSVLQPEQEFELVSPGEMISESKRKIHAKDQRNSGNMA